MRLKASAIALGIATALVLTGCSSSGGNDDDSTTSSGEGAALTIANTAVYDMAGFNETIGSLQGAGSVNFGGATLTLASGASNFGGDLGFSNGTIVINAGQSLTLTAAMSAASSGWRRRRAVPRAPAMPTA